MSDPGPNPSSKFLLITMVVVALLFVAAMVWITFGTSDGEVEQQPVGTMEVPEM